MKQSLFHIESEYLALASALEQGELTPELETALAINEQELQVKAVAYAYVIKDAEANTEAIDNEIARLKGLKQAEERKAEKLKDAISNAMQFYGLNEVKTATIKLSFRKSEAVVCDTDTELPDEFIRVVPEKRSPDLTAIKAAIKEGREVQGYHIESRSNLQIK
jgi:translation elongation factor EF-1beta